MFGFTALVATLIISTVVGTGTGFAIVCITEKKKKKNGNIRNPQERRKDHAKLISYNRWAGLRSSNHNLYHSKVLINIGA